MMRSDDSEALQIGPDPDKLYLYHRQQLSAMLDGELSPDQARFMLRRLQHDAELASCWERWQVCGDVLRGQRNALLPADFAEGVARKIAGDQTADRPAAPAAVRPRLWRWGGGAALAASVAMAALFVGRGQLQAPDGLPAVELPAVAMESSDPTPAESVATPAPDGPVAAEAVLAAAGAAFAVAEVPRRGDERRSRGQSQRAAVTRDQRQARPATVAVAATEAAPGGAVSRSLPATQSAAAPVLAAAGPTTADPFVPAAVPSRPWPRAVLPAATGGSLAVGYGGAGSEAAAFHPFQPQWVAEPSWSGLAPVTAIGPSALTGAGADSGVPSPDPR